MADRRKPDQTQRRRHWWGVILCLSAVLAFTGIHPGAAVGRSDAETCDLAAREAASRYGIPMQLLRAMAEVESGRFGTSAMSAWPWTLNVDGTGTHFATRAEAANRLETGLADGAENIDVGCFQISHRWHGAHFDAPADMLDPVQNADHAARFLSALHAELGDWTQAVGAYHSRSENLATAYRNRVARTLARLAPAPEEPRPPTQDSAKRNSYPLLTARQMPATTGSLVPVAGDTPGRPALF